MPTGFVTTSLVTKRAGIAARFVNLVTKRAVVTKRSATDHPLASMNVDDNFYIFLTPIMNAHILYGDMQFCI